MFLTICFILFLLIVVWRKINCTLTQVGILSKILLEKFLDFWSRYVTNQLVGLKIFRVNCFYRCLKWRMNENNREILKGLDINNSVFLPSLKLNYLPIKGMILQVHYSVKNRTFLPSVCGLSPTESCDFSICCSQVILYQK